MTGEMLCSAPMNATFLKYVIKRLSSFGPSSDLLAGKEVKTRHYRVSWTWCRQGKRDCSLCRKCIRNSSGCPKKYIPDTDAVIELGGEDAKIIFFKGSLEERMNGSCAGGTGAFIDQMATLLNVTVQELDELSLRHEKIYPIASRCGVFAKSDIQPILNQGGRKEDVAASIFQAVVDQTVAGLTQGRELTGKIVFLGGPLFFLKGLRQRFVETLELDGDHAVFPENGDCFAAIGAALCAGGLCGDVL